ncbi:hypothetical protein N7492_009644 [Penicillium capsulatum]|uniref:Uncharacterized protein n=1 Tax=Penicillium capsulatum TaxID=69766 RepID=A0A9W9HSU6_9EURO|nr:hypothetical protein N7492_009644 [Penicillium capsulatum]KAJ6107030.1 hypothetical protein N7512_010547 [Penicillium capsulatum]
MKQFDHCDDRRHFQLVVPRRAQHCPSLRNALFAVAARRMCRLPKYKTPQGILYHGQLLPDLKESSALEYMLRCIPDLVQFPDIQDPIHQENIMAATVILRQYEEMEEEMGDGETDADIYTDERVKFLAITQTIIDSMMASPLDYSNYSLANAAYWIVIRQEIYYALARESVPHLRFDSDRWRNASIPNNVIMFAGEVATWRWGQKLPDEWGNSDITILEEESLTSSLAARLKVKEQQLTQDCQGELDPILEIKADRCRGQIFPVVWYSFDVQVTAIQHFQLARMILIAENPNLEHASRTAHRKAEAQVRSIVLNLCGIAVHHLRVQPALLNAVIAITLYGEYFTNQEERDALIGIIDQTKDIHIWPMRKPYQTLQRRWEVLDSADL